MKWPTLGKRGLIAAIAAVILVVLIGVVASALGSSLAWLILASQIALLVVIVVFARSMRNELHSLMLTRSQSTVSQGAVSIRYEPGEPLDMLRRDIQRDTSALIALNRLVRVNGFVPSPGGWAATPETLLALVSRIISAERIGTVVECGSGTSTIWMALALRERGQGKLVALEHEASYGERTQSVLNALGLAEFVDIRIRPLILRSDNWGDQLWFGDEALEGISDISMLFVDGPPGHLGEKMRFPAVPLLAGEFEPEVRVVLDDVSRPEEQEVLKLWTDREWSGVRLEESGSTDRATILKRVD